MVRIISAALGQCEEARTTLLFANQTEKDILWRTELERLQESFTTRCVSGSLTSCMHHSVVLVLESVMVLTLLYCLNGSAWLP